DRPPRRGGRDRPAPARTARPDGVRRLARRPRAAARERARGGGRRRGLGGGLLPAPAPPVRRPARSGGGRHPAHRLQGLTMPTSETGPRPADVLVVFGITGDLARVMTFRSLYRLERRGLLNCPIVGVAVDDWTDDRLREHARTVIEATGEDLDKAVFDR